MSDFHTRCLEVKNWLDATFPEGSAGALLAIDTALQGFLVSIGLIGWLESKFGSKLATFFLMRAPILLVSTFWGWLTTGLLTFDDAWKGFVAGFIAPTIIALIRGKKPPDDKEPPSTLTTLRSTAGLFLIPSTVSFFVIVLSSLAMTACPVPPPKYTAAQEQCAKDSDTAFYLRAAILETSEILETQRCKRDLDGEAERACILKNRANADDAVAENEHRHCLEIMICAHDTDPEGSCK